jgi:hypothetical protein
MHARKLFLTSAVLLLIGLISLWSKWNGSAGINAGDSVSAWAVTFNGSVHGWPAMIGVISVLGGVLLLLVAIIRWLVGTPRFYSSPAKE